MKTAINTAQEYAELIAEELKNLETIATGAPYGFQPDDETSDNETDSDYRAALTNLEMAHDTESPLDTWLNETALDLAILRDTRGGEFGQRIEILRTCGGPTCYITRDSNDGSRIEIRVSDGYKQHTHNVYLNDLANYLDEMGDQ
jgi:hypothetical protein